MDVHLRELRALVAVADEGTVTGAATRLHLAQPALSKQLQALEREVGAALLERRPRGVVLTEAGRALLDHARAAVAAWDAGRAAVRATIKEARLVIGMQTAVGRGLQRAAMRRFAELAPDVTPSLRLVGWDDPSAGLGDGSSDVAFVWLPLDRPPVDVLPVATEPRHVALPADSPFSSARAVPFADLLDEPFVALPASAGPLRDWWLATDARAGRPAVVGAVAETADAALEEVASGLGVALVAAGNGELYRRPGVVTRPVTGIAPAVLALAWRADERRPVVAAFVRAVEESLPG